MLKRNKKIVLMDKKTGKFGLLYEIKEHGYAAGYVRIEFEDVFGKFKVNTKFTIDEVVLKEYDVVAYL